MHALPPVDRPAVTPPASPIVPLETHCGPYLFTFHPRSSGIVVSRCVYVDHHESEVHGHLPIDAAASLWVDELVDLVRLEGWARWWLMRRGEWDRETRVVRVSG